MLETAIIGGGAAGVMAAIAASNHKTHITILERKERILKKLLATGNGRCNYTNINAGVSDYFGHNVESISNILSAFTPQDTINFFSSLGVEPKYRDNGRVYPLSDQSSSVVDALRFKLTAANCDIKTNFNIVNIKQSKNKFTIHSESGECITVDKVILAAGGMSSPELGSNGSGFELAKRVGHSITNLSPALVQLKTESEAIKGLQGIKVESLISAINGSEIVAQEEGELLFTDYGISGNAVFNISYIVPQYDKLSFNIDFLPFLNRHELYSLLKKRKRNLHYLTLENFLNGMINKKLGQFILKKSGFEKLSISVTSLTDENLENISQKIKNYKIKNLEAIGFKSAQVTAGGISLNEVDMQTLESKKIKNLYFAGEVLDVFGKCGGYNLQWAWASGYVAGVNQRDSLC